MNIKAENKSYILKTKRTNFSIINIFRNNYIIAPTDKSILILDKELNLIKEIFIFKNLVVDDIYIKHNEEEIILNCIDINDCIVKINIKDFSYNKIDIQCSIYGERYEYSKIYFWESNFIIIIQNSGDILKIELYNDYNAYFISSKELSEDSSTFAKFYKHMKKNCKPNNWWRAKHWMFWVKYLDFYRDLYFVKDEENREFSLINLKENTKTILPVYNEFIYTFDYRYGIVLTIQEYQLEGFINGKKIFSLDYDEGRIFGAKLVQDLYHRYLIVVRSSFKGKNMHLTRYIIE